MLRRTSVELGKTLYFSHQGKPLINQRQPGVAMTFILALFQTVSDLFASPHLPMDSEYSYEARHREAERLRRSQVSLFGILGD